jgi:hypothetical protein
MPEIEVTEDQRDRLRDLQRRLEEAMPSPYAHVRPTDAVAYLLDRHAETDGVDLDGADEGSTEDASGGDEHATESESSGDLPSGPMSLLADHDEVWREGSGDARYEVDLPDGSTAEARTRGDVRALLFEHYR